MSLRVAVEHLQSWLNAAPSPSLSTLRAGTELLLQMPSQPQCPNCYSPLEGTFGLDWEDSNKLNVLYISLFNSLLSAEKKVEGCNNNAFKKPADD